ncbi:MAG: NAD(P)H-hydrate dehydratase [Cohaesibacter sp.]|nr:NAD(P)H-hydrate dehydratase [Cohaesibacter sp.]
MTMLRDPLEILLPTQMAEADRLTIEGGIPGYDLMEKAGEAVAVAAQDLLEEQTGSSAAGMVCILCGPGNNGGDGFVAARLLEEEGWSALVGCSTEIEHLSGDARLAADDWADEIYPLSSKLWQDADLVIDALFGAGLDRPVTGDLADLIDELNESGLPVLSVDLPSGVEGGSGLVRGVAVRAHKTVSFFAHKPGHLLYPGAAYCGDMHLAQIGIEVDVLEECGSTGLINDPSLWRADLPECCKPLGQIDPFRLADHKFHRGHCLVVSGGTTSSGAARLAARACLRSGAGLVTLAPPHDAAAVVAAQVTSVMVEPISEFMPFEAILSARNYDALLLGPGMGLDEEHSRLVSQALKQDGIVVLDADALTLMAERGEAGLEVLRTSLPAQNGQLILTPHEGEFARLFPDLSHRLRAQKGGSKISCAIEAARRSGAIIILKGADSVIANPDGLAVVQSNGVPYLATAGSGDVLAGLVAGLAGQGMVPFEAACAAVWLHMEAGKLLGAGLISEDLPDCLPTLYAKLFA